MTFSGACAFTPLTQTRTHYPFHLLIYTAQIHSKSLTVNAFSHYYPWSINGCASLCFCSDNHLPGHIHVLLSITKSLLPIVRVCVCVLCVPCVCVCVSALCVCLCVCVFVCVCLCVCRTCVCVLCVCVRATMLPCSRLKCKRATCQMSCLVCLVSSKTVMSQSRQLLTGVF